MDNPSAVPHINDAGQVVWTGHPFINPHLSIPHAFLWSEGVVTDLVVGRPSAAADINERGEVAGNTLDGGQVFVWSNGTLQYLPSLGGAASAIAINNLGQVVGTSLTTSSTIAHAVLWEDGQVTDLGVLPGDSLSGASAITASGQVAGMSYNDRFAGGHPFLWRNGVLLPMSPTYLTDPLFVQLVGVNQDGTAAGNRNGSGAVVLEDGVTWTLPTLDGGIGTRATAINARGDVVGVVTMPSPILSWSDHRAVLWRRINPTVAALPSP
jgi:probable HAF family extracellular repeat protein